MILKMGFLGDAFFSVPSRQTQNELPRIIWFFFHTYFLAFVFLLGRVEILLYKYFVHKLYGKRKKGTFQCLLRLVKDFLFFYFFKWIYTFFILTCWLLISFTFDFLSPEKLLFRRLFPVIFAWWSSSEFYCEFCLKTSIDFVKFSVDSFERILLKLKGNCRDFLVRVFQVISVFFY